MKVDLSRFRDTFFEEASEHLEELESGLLRLEETPDDPELLNAVFRSAHSVKGGSGMFGLTEVSRFTHVLEGVLDRMREGSLPASSERVGVLLRSVDVLRLLLSAARDGDDPPPGADALIVELTAQTEGGTGPEGGAAAAGPTASDSGSTPSDSGLASAGPGWRVSFRPGPDVLRQGMDPLLLLRDLAELGEMHDVEVDTSALPPLESLDPERSYLAWTLTLDTSEPESSIRDIFAFIEDEAEITVAPTASSASVAEAPSEPATPPPSPSGTSFVERRGGGDRRAQTFDVGSIRVPAERVDELINLVGELVISQSMVNQVVASLDLLQHPLLEGAAMAVDRNVRELQERILAVRMTPIARVFARFPRMVRDLSAAMDKRIALEMVGEDTELDRGVIERIADPLTHLVRNAVDHGIETSDVRRAAGKPEEATVRLSAVHEGGGVLIEIADDGRGLDVERIRAKAVAQSLIGAEERLSAEQVYALIFQPGFSTAAVVSDVSGRGVGLDVVRRNIEELNGAVGVESEPGVGTRFRIKLPLTLAILEGMSLGVGGRTYILPLLAIVESFRPASGAVKSVLGHGEVVVVRGESVPLVRLHRVFGISGAEVDPTRALIVIVENEGRRVGLVVDELLDQSQIVIKNLEANYGKVDGLMGATILGDGRVALILDVAGIVRLAGERGEPDGFEDPLLAPSHAADAFGALSTT